MAGSGIGMQAHLLLEADAVQGLPGIGDVPRRAPGVRVNEGAPLPHIRHTVLAQGIEDVARLLAEILLHLHVRTQVGGRRMVIARVEHFRVPAPVVFQVVDAPCIPGLGVLLFMAQGTQIAAAGAVARGRIDAQFQSVGMEPVGEALHVRELVVRADGSVRIALGRLPGIVDIDVGIAVIRQTGIQESGGRRHHPLLRDAGAPAVPGVPAHGRGQGDLRSHFQREFSTGFALGILCDENQRVIPFLCDAAAQDTLVRIQLHPFRKAFDGIFHGLVTRESQSENDRGTGADAEHERSVVTRCGRCRRREDVRRADFGLERLVELVIPVDDSDPGVLRCLDRKRHLFLRRQF